MTAIIRLRKGTRNHTVYLRNGETLNFRSQREALDTVRTLVRLGVVTTVKHMTR